MSGQRVFETTVRQFDERENLIWLSEIEIGAVDHIDALIALSHEYPAQEGYTHGIVKEITHA